jgi:hypothetical protein
MMYHRDALAKSRPLHGANILAAARILSAERR